MTRIKNSVSALFYEHQTIASILTIILSFIAINSWMTSDIRSDIKETNKRIDALFHYVLSGKSMEKKE